eukprot:NODE_1758_length_613_cov_0.396887.p1 type:complete len:169 gc:universal NODE_1758_length_613_cov_0.396887:611-105(-)
MAGELRPDFLNVCSVDFSKSPDFTYLHPYNSGKCGNENDLNVMQARQSFPSGHSSMSFAGLTFLSLFIWHFRWKFLLFAKLFATLPLILAAFIALSRLVDNHHHPFDVIFGSLLGILGAFIGRHWTIHKIKERKEFIENEDQNILPVHSQVDSIPQDTEYQEEKYQIQ